MRQPDPADSASLVVVPELVVLKGASSAVPQDVAAGPSGDLFVSAEEAGVWRFGVAELPAGAADSDGNWPAGIRVGAGTAGTTPGGIWSIAVDVANNVFIDTAGIVVRVPPPGASGPADTEPFLTWQRCSASSSTEALTPAVHCDQRGDCQRSDCSGKS